MSVISIANQRLDACTRATAFNTLLQCLIRSNVSARDVALLPHKHYYTALVLLFLKMPVLQTIPYNEGTFFITFTCYDWLPLIEKTDGYDLIYKWFDHLKSKGHSINGYVIMPNHLHALISFTSTGQSINTIIGNGKRFIAYEIIKRLEAKQDKNLLLTLSSNVEAKRKQNNKLHEVWKLSFDWKYCNSMQLIKQKLSYMHDNPCTGKWQLCDSPIKYLHSSAKYYITGEDEFYKVTGAGDD